MNRADNPQHPDTVASTRGTTTDLSETDIAALSEILATTPAITDVVRQHMRIPGVRQRFEFDDLRQELILVMLKTVRHVYRFDAAGSFDGWVRSYARCAIRGITKVKYQPTTMSDLEAAWGPLDYVAALKAEPACDERSRSIAEFIESSQQRTVSPQLTAWRESIAIRDMFDIPQPKRLFGIQRTDVAEAVADDNQLLAALTDTTHPGHVMFADWGRGDQEYVAGFDVRVVRAITTEAIGAFPWPGGRTLTRFESHMGGFSPAPEWASTARDLTAAFFASEVADPATLSDTTTRQAALRLTSLARRACDLFPTIVGDISEVAAVLHDTFWVKSRLPLTFNGDPYEHDSYAA